MLAPTAVSSELTEKLMLLIPYRLSSESKLNPNKIIRSIIVGSETSITVQIGGLGLCITQIAGCLFYTCVGYSNLGYKLVLMNV